MSWEFWTRRVPVGGVEFTPVSLLLGLVLIVGLAVGVSLLKRVLRERVLPRVGFSRPAAAAVSTLTGYFVLLVGLLSVLPIVFPGFNLNTLSVILGAISFGIGFGLRNIADNFVSGLILLVEQPIKVGDRIEAAGTNGEVVEIRARSTVVRTNDNIEIIIPNSQLISEQVTNWSHSDARVRMKIPVGVHYRSDVRAVEQALVAAARRCDAVLEQPAPSVRFLEFGDSSLNLELRVWTERLTHRPGLLRSELNFLIWEEFKKAGIEIPYPQRDLYVKELPPVVTATSRP
jgi:small-conductance mechanosensitive channel